MKFLSLREYQANSQDIIYRYSLWLPLSFLVIFFLGAIGLGFFVITLPESEEKTPLYILISLCVTAMWFTRGAFAARRGSQNWLLTTHAHGVTIKFRSFRNHHFSALDRVIAYIPYREIEWVRACTRKKTTTSDRGGITIETLKCVEIRLCAADANKLDELIREEMSRKGPVIKTWYGHTSHRMLHFPIRLIEDGTLRIEWRVRPGIGNFLQSVARHVTVLQPIRIHDDYTKTSLRQVDPARQENRVRNLVAEGDTLSAIKLVRELYTCSIVEAKNIVENMKSTPPRSS